MSLVLIISPLGGFSGRFTATATGIAVSASWMSSDHPAYPDPLGRI